MLSDSGAELLVAAISRQAREDLEEAYAQAVLARRVCERGRTGPYRRAAGAPAAHDATETALWWFSGRDWLPSELRAMTAVVAGYRRYCLNCGKKEG